MAGKLIGKVALVTGGSTGIGLATAKAFAKEDAKVFITGRRERELKAAAAEIGGGVRAIQGDASDLSSLDATFEIIRAEAGCLDVIFANAGGGSFSPLGSITEEEYASTFDRNVKGLLFTVQKALPLLADGSSIILNGSTSASKGIPAFSVYAASKAAVRSLLGPGRRTLRAGKFA